MRKKSEFAEINKELETAVKRMRYENKHLGASLRLQNSKTSLMKEYDS
jgi:hypothetical protein